VIYVKKFRTMHPYSEYLQEYVYHTNDLQEGGKFKDDFRVTSWGKVMRAMWIDELPQFSNFFKGELALVGVRALSEHYYSLTIHPICRICA
jgi:lipopolysaccharide/colanic/teichoic acid biosynthesis glycosyltransferase